MEAIVGALVKTPLNLTYLSIVEPIPSGGISFSKLNGVLKVDTRIKEIEKHKVLKAADFWEVFGRGKTILENKFLKCHPSMVLTAEEDQAVSRLIEVFRKDIEEKLEEVKSTKNGKEEYFNVVVAHNLFGPLTDECVLNDSHKTALTDYKKNCKTTSSCHNCHTLKIPSAVGLDGLCMGHRAAWYGEPDMINVVPVVCSDAAQTCLDDNGDSPGTGVEGKLSFVKVSSTFGQTVGTAITYSFIQRKRHPKKTPLVPTVYVCPEGFYVLLYDCEYDNLLYSQQVIWSTCTVVYLWLILHHRLFVSWRPEIDEELCSGYFRQSTAFNCGFPFVDELLYCKNINNAKFKDESKSSQRLNSLPKIDIQAYVRK